MAENNRSQSILDGIAVDTPVSRQEEPFVIHWDPLYKASEAKLTVKPAHKKVAADLSYDMAGRLYMSADGWCLLSVPNAVARGAFDALHVPGIELPPGYNGGAFNAHITVMRPDEVEAIGGPSKISERGHTFRYTTGPVRSTNPSGWENISKCWFIEVTSPELEKLRKSYGLSARPNNNKFDFHITIAVRRKGVLQANDTKKASDEGPGVEIKPSEIDGKGIFATKKFSPDDVIVPVCLVPKEGQFHLDCYDETDEARYCNHSDEPNADIRKNPDDTVALIAKKAIQAGDEVTVNYHDLPKTLGDSFYFTYKDKPYFGESTSGAPPFGTKDSLEKAAMVDQFGSFLPVLQQMIVNPFINNWAAQHGLLYAPGAGNVSDRLSNMRTYTGDWQATTGAMSEDRGTYRRMLSGLARLAGSNPDKNPEMQRAIDSASGDISTIAPYIRMFAPQLWDRLHGWRGSAASLGSQVFRTAKTLRDPITGQRGISADDATSTAKRIFSRLYGPNANRADTSGFSASQMSDIYSNASDRGLLSSQTPMSPEQTADRLSSLSQPFAAARDMMAEHMPKQGAVHTQAEMGCDDEGNEHHICPHCDKALKKEHIYKDKKGWLFCRTCLRKGKGPIKLAFSAGEGMDILEKLTQGQLSNLDPQQVSQQVRQLHNLAKSTPGGLPRLFSLIGHGGDVAQSAGLPRLFASRTAPGAAAFGRAFGQFAGRQGFNGLTMDDAVDLDQRLRTSASNSPMANIMGATLALEDAGLIRPGTPAAQIADNIRAGKPVMPDGTSLGTVNAQQWVALLQQSGVSPGAAWNQFRSQQVNQEYVYKNGLTDIVRNSQREVEVMPVMQNYLGQGMIPTLSAAGIVGPQQAQVIAPLIQSMSKMLTSLPHDALTGSRKDLVQNLAAQLAQAHPDVARQLGPNGLSELAHTSLTNLDQTIQSDPRFKPYRNTIGLLSAHRPDILRAGDAATSDADFEGRLQGQMAHAGQTDWIQRISDTLQEAQPSTPFTSLAAQGFGAVPMDQLGAGPVNQLKLPPSLQPHANEIGQARQKRVNEFQPTPPTK